MNTPTDSRKDGARNALDGLAEVMGLLRRPEDKSLVGADLADARNLAAVAAVNYLRSHGEAIRELVEADRAYDAAMAQRERIDGGTRFMDAKRRRSAALAKFPEPRS